MIGENADSHEVRIDAEVIEQFDRHVAFRVKQAKKDVYHADMLVAEGFRLALGPFEGTFRPRHEGEMPGHFNVLRSCHDAREVGGASAGAEGGSEHAPGPKVSSARLRTSSRSIPRVRRASASASPRPPAPTS